MARRRAAALTVFDTEKLAYDEPVADGKAWSDVPLCSESGLDIDYLMLRGIFTTPGASEEEVAYYVDLLEKVRATPDGREFIAKGAFKAFMTGDEFRSWLTAANDQHKGLMEKASFLAQ